MLYWSVRQGGVDNFQGGRQTKRTTHYQAVAAAQDVAACYCTTAGSADKRFFPSAQ